MAYDDFLREFAIAQKVPDVPTLLRDYSEKYSFQIHSRKRALDVAEELRSVLAVDLKGLRVLDVGCAYGSFAVEFAKLGCHVVGIDINDKWLKLAEANARGEADCTFLKIDASSYRARKDLKAYGPFDIVVVNDVFEHIFDTAGLLENLKALMRPGARLYFKVPNGLAVRSVISEGHKKVFGISLLAPDYWQMFVTAPFHIYYRRETYFAALFNHYGFKPIKDLITNTDPSIEQTRKHIAADLAKVRKMTVKDEFSPPQYAALRHAVDYYTEEVNNDLETMEWNALFRKYRATFWVGLLQV
jgi:2-polyprenyl-3-methyl-5-hydroxy-6-metoxy-1,4-benzoquinol methylase